MAIAVNPATYVIFISQADLIFVSGTLYRLNTETFREELKAWEDDEEGIIQPKTHLHNTTVVIVGTTYARSINILPPYSIEFEDGQYTVLLENSNNNIFDVASGILVQNQVQVIPSNSAGLIVGTGGGSSVWTELEKDDLIADVTLVLADTNEIQTKLPTDGNNISSDQQVADATGVWSTLEKDNIIADVTAIFNKLPADGGDMPSLANVNNLVGAGLTAGQIAQLQAIFDKLPVSGLISNEANVAALIGQGLTAGESANLL